MSVSVTKINGLVVVTQVFPEGEEKKISIPDPVSVHVPVPPAETKTELSVLPSSRMSPMTRLFLQGQPKPLGIVQIFIGLMTVALGIITFFDRPFILYAPLWTGLMYIASGALSVAAHEGTQASMIRGTLALNIISAVMAVTGAVVFCFELSMRPGESGCQRGSSEYYYSGENYYWDCVSTTWKYNLVMDGFKGLLLVLAVLEFCVALSGAIFAGKAICSSSSSQPVVVVVEKPVMGGVDSTSLCDSDVALLNSGNAPNSPPPYDA
ncbi:membrane-spanning 4-domains subfamily A member 4A [Megalops cyprinoides]|uniref:membrane-spanning 4-domains subfamily A member 4A n=1 Tax=Megalops cyprinoides TaxID=118141 RepID=UPI001864FB08|nr:membrane-spanning 4-domains subfamily A member 4A [Megalops cyprinoides]